METVKVVQTYKDGILTSSKKIVVPDPINPETEKLQRSPKHHRVLDLTDAAQLSLNDLQHSFDTLKGEIRKLRKKLVASERAVCARTKERDALKKAYTRKSQQNASLEEKNEELEAKLFAVTGDLKFLEEHVKKQALYAQNSKPTTATATPTPTPTATPTATSTPKEPVRSIAAKPVKR
jgi:chromosome segregation ATPase